MSQLLICCLLAGILGRSPRRTVRGFPYSRPGPTRRARSRWPGERALREALRELYTGIGAKVRRARNRRGWTQLELARAVGLSKYSITNVEAGRQRPPVHMALLIARALDVPVDELLPSGPEPEKRVAGTDPAADQGTAREGGREAGRVTAG
jgi:DNA-binding XRE family transcriptional regulator